MHDAQVFGKGSENHTAISLQYQALLERKVQALTAQLMDLSGRGPTARLKVGCGIQDVYHKLGWLILLLARVRLYVLLLCNWCQVTWTA